MAISGLGGGVYAGTNKVAEIKDWKLDIDADTLDTSTFDGNGWKTFIAGQRGWSGSFGGQWKMSDVTGQKAWQDAMLAGTTLVVKLDVNGTNNYTGTAFIKKQSVSTPSNAVVDINFDFQGNGALTYV
jgi:predicted secreted protein